MSRFCFPNEVLGTIMFPEKNTGLKAKFTRKISGKCSFGHNLKLQTEFTDTSEPILIISQSLFGFNALGARIPSKGISGSESFSSSNFEQNFLFRNFPPMIHQWTTGGQWWVTMGCQCGYLKVTTEPAFWLQSKFLCIIIKTFTKMITSSIEPNLIFLKKIDFIFF